MPVPILTSEMDILDLLGDFKEELEDLDPYRIIDDDEMDVEEVNLLFN